MGRGHPRNTWRNSIKEDVTAWILSMDMAADRDAWRHRIHDANRHSNTIRRVQQNLNA